VLFSAEAWTRSITSDELDDHHRGDLQRAGEAGDPTVQEGVICSFVSLDDIWAATANFRRTPDGVEWGETKVMNGIAGAFADVLIRAVR
jgi:hypothetical protein